MTTNTSVAMDITIYRNQLKLDADIETRKAGYFQVDKEHPEERNEAQMGLEDSDMRFFEGQCQQGINDLLLVLHRFVEGCSGETTMTTDSNNRVENTKQWVISLHFDSRRHIITRSLASLCHKYVLMHVLQAWAMMTMPNLVAGYTEQMTKAESAILQMVYRKEPPTLQPD